MLPDRLPRIERPPVVLRPFRTEDADLVLSAGGDIAITGVTTVAPDGDLPQAVDWVERQHHRLTTGHGYSFAVADAATDRAVGQIGLWTPEVEHGRASAGYWIGPAFRTRGYATAALAALTEWALALEQVHRVELHVEPSNVASCRVAEACGFEREGLLRSWLPVGDDRRDVHVYSVVRRSTRT
ncbi:MAG: GNAT family N-acetyltransferase [Dermatophilaceae bacterium]